jgi:hypothetical protein
MIEPLEAWSRIQWQARRGGRVIWLSGEDGVETASLVARSISCWRTSGLRVLFADFSSGVDPESFEPMVLLSLLGVHAGQARATVSLWRRLEAVLAESGPDARVILDRIESAGQPSRAVVSTIHHLVTRHGGTLLVVSPRNDRGRSRVLSAWADLEIGQIACGVESRLVA